MDASAAAGRGGEPLIRLENCEMRFGRYGEVLAVEDVSLSIAPGEKVALLGATGSGKSTILNLVTGVLTPTAGSVHVAGHVPSRDWNQLQGTIAMAFQTPGLLPWRDALGNVMVGLEILGVSRSEREQRAREWLTRVKLDHAMDRYPAQLSGGMRQRVSLARALAIDPHVLLLDEAFSALDEVTAIALRRDFLDLWSDRDDHSILMVTHSINEAMEVADRVIILRPPAVIAAEYDTSWVTVDRDGATEARRHEVSREIFEVLAEAQREAEDKELAALANQENLT